jgi:predicted Zn finger-like uncharacterized protein
MSDDQFTRCPGCKTVFRVTDAQLALRGGQVRCGHCRTVFNGETARISLVPQAPLAHDDVHDELSSGPPTVTLRSARALDPAPPDDRSTPPYAPPAATPGALPPIDMDYENRFARDRKRAPSRFWKTAGKIGVPVLTLTLVLQAVFHFRDAVAAYVPATRPLLTRVCVVAGCQVRPLRDVSVLGIDASDLQADPAHRGLLILSATLRNRAPYPVGYPHLELTLTDAQDKAVVRRALAPAEYAGGTADTGGGIPGNGEVPVKLFIDASATTQAGYRLYLFFP